MNLKDKLKNFPLIYYINLDEREDRRIYTENQYEKYNIKKYVRYSASKYMIDNFDEWKNKLILNDVEESPRKNMHIIQCAMTLTHLELMKHWIENTNENHILIMEDDYDLSCIEYWHFDWDYLMNNLPYDWDCIQLSFENNKVVPCFFHKILPGHSMGAALVNRKYAEKIVSIMAVDEKFDLTKKVSNYHWCQMSSHPKLKNNLWHHPNISMDYILGHSGSTYCIPLITQSNTIGSYSNNILREKDFPALHFTHRAVNLWWKKFRDTFSLEDFFMYGKPNDFFITTKNINYLESK